MKIIQIVSELPPTVGGVSAYVMKLAEELLHTHQLQTHFICFYNLSTKKQEDKSKFSSNLFQATNLISFNQEEILSRLPENFKAIIFHYSFNLNLDSQYRLASHLLEILIFLKKKFSFKLIIMFHELFPFGYKGKLKFWHNYYHSYFSNTELLPARGFAKIADDVITDSGRFQKILSKWSKSLVKCFPDFSTVGEPKIVPESNKRERNLIVFGLPYSRRRVYSKHSHDILKICQVLNLNRVYDIGCYDTRITNILNNLKKLNKVKFIETGALSPEMISKLMLSSYAGLFDYSHCPGDLGKSTVFAAYCAHGLVPISTKYNPSEEDGIFQNIHYIVSNRKLKLLTPTELQYIAKNAIIWYSGHSSSKIASYFASSIKE